MALVGIPAAHVDGDVGDAVFDEAAGGEEALPDLGASVARAHFGRFLREVERLGGAALDDAARLFAGRQEIAEAQVVDHHGAGFGVQLFPEQGGQGDLPGGKVDAARKDGHDGHDDVVRKGGYQILEHGADDDADGHVEHIALNGKFLKFLPELGFFLFCHECCLLFYFFSMTSRPPRYLRSTSGTTTEPSARWFCSTMAGKMREVARPEPLRV